MSPQKTFEEEQIQVSRIPTTLQVVDQRFVQEVSWERHLKKTVSEALLVEVLVSRLEAWALPSIVWELLLVELVSLLSPTLKVAALGRRIPGSRP